MKKSPFRSNMLKYNNKGAEISISNQEVISLSTGYPLTVGKHHETDNIQKFVQDTDLKKNTMTLSLQYDEINKMLLKHTGYEFEIEYVSNDTVHISLNILLPIFGKKTIGIDIKILGFNDTTLQLQAASDVLAKVLELMPTLNISHYAVVEKDIIHILLGNVEQLRKPLALMRPTDIRLDKEYLHLDGKLL